MALSVANLARGSDAGSGNSEGRGGLPPDREASSPLRGSSTLPEHMPSTGQTDETKPKKGTAYDEKLSQPGASDLGGTAPKHPSSHAERHPDYDRMDANKNKALDKESH